MAILIEADVLIHRWHYSEVDHVQLILIASEPLLQGGVGRAAEVPSFTIRQGSCRQQGAAATGVRYKKPSRGLGF